MKYLLQPHPIVRVYIEVNIQAEAEELEQTGELAEHRVRALAASTTCAVMDFDIRKQELIKIGNRGLHHGLTRLAYAPGICTRNPKLHNVGKVLDAYIQLNKAQLEAWESGR